MLGRAGGPCYMYLHGCKAMMREAEQEIHNGLMISLLEYERKVAFRAPVLASRRVSCQRTAFLSLSCRRSPLSFCQREGIPNDFVARRLHKPCESDTAEYRRTRGSALRKDGSVIPCTHALLPSMFSPLTTILFDVYMFFCRQSSKVIKTEMF